MARSITDKEIGLIKALLARGERNVDIQFYFNRQDRPANSGRISQIRKGTYGPDVPQASETELDAFLEQFQQIEVGVNLADASQQPPTLSERAANQFEQRDDGNWHLRDGETSQQECKEIFNPKKLVPIVKAIAGLSNNKGGFIFLGVEDSEGRVVGLPDQAFEETDIVTISQKVKSFLTPTPDFTKIQIDVGGNSVGVLYVEEHNEPPVIVIKDGEGIESGSILFRSPGQTAKISAGDLILLLKQRDLSNQNRLLKSAQRISEIGLSNSLIVDTSEGSLEADGARISIDRELADQLEFIREGEFEEVAGAPTLKLVGDVRAVDAEGEVRERIVGRALTADTVLRAFLDGEKVRNPIEYIKESALVQRQWLPLYYFIGLSGLSTAEALAMFREIDPVYAKSKEKALERLSGDLSAYRDVAGSASPILQKFLELDFETIEDDFEDRHVVQAIQALPDDFEETGAVSAILEHIFERAENRSNLKSAVFRAAARIDEVAFRPPE